MWLCEGAREVYESINELYTALDRANYYLCLNIFTLVSEMRDNVYMRFRRAY